MLSQEDTTRLHLAMRSRTNLQGVAWDWCLAYADNYLEDLEVTGKLNYTSVADLMLRMFYDFTMNVSESNK